MSRPGRVRDLGTVTTQWCDPPCVLPALHHGDCWDGTHCETCPSSCHYCSGTEACPCLENHAEDDV